MFPPEFVPGGSIASLVKRFGAFPEDVVRKYTREIVEGLSYLHANGVIHRSRPPPPWLVCVCVSVCECVCVCVCWLAGT